MKLYLLATLVLAVSLPQTLGARILAFLPMPGKSHQAYFTPLLRELGNRGHHVTAYIPFPMKDPPPKQFYTEIIVPNVFQKILDTFNPIDYGKQPALVQEVMLRQLGFLIQNDACESRYLKDLLSSNQKFDAVILESLFVQESFTALAHRFGAVAIEMLPLGSFHWAFEVVGNPYNPSYMIDYKVVHTDNMGFMERLYNTLVSYGTSAFGYYYMRENQKLMDKCFKYPGSETRPPIVQLLSNTSLLLLNSHLSVNYPYPMSPHVVEVGGLHILPNKPLPKDIQTFMDNAKDGVIYFSLGSAMNTSLVVKDGIFKAFDSAFRKLKQKVLWKWEQENFSGKSANVKTSSWFPQQDILAHKNCRIFITHGGFLSISEAVNFGVPMIGIPIFAEQPKNMKQVTSAGYGIQLNYDELTEENISAAIKEILSNPSYKEAVKERSKWFKERPQTPLETATYWTEYVIKYKGAPHLRPALTRMPWYKSMLLDVIGLYLAVLLSLLTLTYLMVRKFVTFICCRQRRPADKKSKKKTN